MPVTLNGTNGVTFNDGSSQATAARDFGFKNRIINGAMMIDQRNAGAATTGATSSPYTLDRWKVYSGGANCTVQRVAGFNGFQNAMRITGVASNNGISVFQRIESFNTFDLASQSITASFVTNSSVASRTVDIVFINPTTNADDYGATTEFARQTITVPNGVGVHRVTVTGGSGVIRGIQFVIELGALTSGTIDITGVQLEKGSTATSFDYRPYGTELALCQRYYFKSLSSSSNAYLSNFGSTVNSTTARFATAVPVEMRATPTVGYSNVGIDKHTASYSISNLAIFGGISKTVVGLAATSSGMTGDQPVVLFSNSGATGYIDYSAEL